jgi:hypothetical protein
MEKQFSSVHEIVKVILNPDSVPLGGKIGFVRVKAPEVIQGVLHLAKIG